MSSPEFYRSIDFFPTFDETKCTLCLDCLRNCGLSVIELVRDGTNGKARLKARRHVCRNCRSCVQTCSAGAVQITAELGGTNAGHLKKDLCK